MAFDQKNLSREELLNGWNRLGEAESWRGNVTRAAVALCDLLESGEVEPEVAQAIETLYAAMGGREPAPATVEG